MSNHLFMSGEKFCGWRTAPFKPACFSGFACCSDGNGPSAGQDKIGAAAAPAHGLFSHRASFPENQL